MDGSAFVDDTRAAILYERDGPKGATGLLVLVDTGRAEVPDANPEIVRLLAPGGDLAVAPDGQLLAVATDVAVFVLDPRRPKDKRPVQSASKRSWTSPAIAFASAHELLVHEERMDPSKERLAELSRWDLRSMIQEWVRPVWGGRRLGASPDGRLAVYVRKMRGGDERRLLAVHYVGGRGQASSSMPADESAKSPTSPGVSKE